MVSCARLKLFGATDCASLALPCRAGLQGHRLFQAGVSYARASSRPHSPQCRGSCSGEKEEKYKVPHSCHRKGVGPSALTLKFL